MATVELTRETALGILAAQRRDNPREFAIGAIARLNERRTGRASDDAWIDYAIGQWRAFLRENKV